MGFTLTEQHLAIAVHLGEVHAQAEYDLEVPISFAIENDPVSDEEDRRSLAFKVTAVKLDPASDDVDQLVNAYTEAYYDKWEELVRYESKT